MVIIITGAHKALALQKCIEEGVNHMWTLSSLQLHPHPLIVIDEDATLELRVKTVKVTPQSPTYLVVTCLASEKKVSDNPAMQYFKSIENVASELGFRQMLPRKRDSFIEAQNTAPFTENNSLKLAVPPQDVSRSVSPVLGPMSARISDEDANAQNLQALDALAEPQLMPMSARVTT